jgi:predicted MFS family arabinose efflux permease
MASTQGEEAETRLPNRWRVVGLLWFCGFFNYADRQAVFSLFPLLKDEFHLSQEQLGTIGSSFMIVYALSAPLAGMLVDRMSRRVLIAAGLGVWSAICAATGMVTRFSQMLFFRAAEGLGESFYFPASMSLLADYHGPTTRSRAMSVHQTSVYAGTAAGGLLAGYLGQRYGWRSPFWVLGLVGILYALWLPFQFAEPVRGGADPKPDLTVDLPPPPSRWRDDYREILRQPAAVMLLAAFAAANFVAATLLSWLPQYVKSRFDFLDLTNSAAVASIFMPTANFVGAILGGLLADRAARRSGGRILVQASGLLLGAPCIYAVGTASSLQTLVPALIGIGLCKGIYDANIFASVYDLIVPSVRGTAAGLMNTVGWAGAGLAPWLIGRAGDRWGLSRAITATALLYLLAAALAAFAAFLARQSKSAGG